MRVHVIIIIVTWKENKYTDANYLIVSNAKATATNDCLQRICGISMKLSSLDTPMHYSGFPYTDYGISQPCQTCNSWGIFSNAERKLITVPIIGAHEVYKYFGIHISFQSLELLEICPIIFYVAFTLFN